MKIYGTRPAKLNNIIDSMNTTHINRKCILNKKHGDSDIISIKLELNKPLNIKKMGLYKFEYDNKNYVINIPYNNDNQYIIMSNIYNLSLYIDGIFKYRLLPYEIIETDENEKYVNSYFDMFFITGHSVYIGDNIGIETPIKINRYNEINIYTDNGDELNIKLPYSMGRLNSGIYDKLILDSENMICNFIMNTNYEMLTGAYEYEYMKDLSTPECSVFFIKNENIEPGLDNNSIMCSHFPVVDNDSFYNKENNINSITVPADKNGLLLKINKNYLDITSGYVNAIEKFINSYAVSSNPIYIEYKLLNPEYITMLLDEYHLKTTYPKTVISSIKSNIDGNNIACSKFFKTL